MRDPTGSHVSIVNAEGLSLYRARTKVVRRPIFAVNQRVFRVFQTAGGVVNSAILTSWPHSCKRYRPHTTNSGHTQLH